MMYDLRIYPAAERDLDEAAMYIARDSYQSAIRLYDAADETFRAIRSQPMLWPIYELDHPRLQGVRWCAIKGFRNYLVFYTVNGQYVDVIRVLHGARDLPRTLDDRTG